MALIVCLLVLLISCANLLDFLIGHRTDRRLKDRLVSLYVILAEGDWTRVFAKCAMAVSAFIEHILARRILSFRFIARTILLSATSTALACILFGARYDSWESYLGSWQELLESDYKIVLVFVCGNVVADLIGWPLGLYLLRVLASCRPGNAPFILLLSIASAYVLYGLSMFGDIFMSNNLGWLPITEELTFSKIIEGPYYMITEPDRYGIKYFLMTPLMPFFLLTSALITSATIYVTKPFSQRPLMIVVERIEESPRGIFTIAAAVISGCVAILGALGNLAK